MDVGSRSRWAISISVGIVVTVAVAALAALLSNVSAVDLWDLCRRANPYLAGAAWFAVSIRFGMMLADRRRWRDRRALHLLAWFGWIVASLLVSVLGSSYYADGPTPANYTSGARTLLNIAAIALAIWWPHPLRYEPTTPDRGEP